MLGAEEALSTVLTAVAVFFSGALLLLLSRGWDKKVQNGFHRSDHDILLENSRETKKSNATLELIADRTASLVEVAREHAAATADVLDAERKYGDMFGEYISEYRENAALLREHTETMESRSCVLKREDYVKGRIAPKDSPEGEDK
jgi:hypothetical protein